MCGPRGLRGAPDHLFRNNGDGTFTDTTSQAGVTDDKGLYGFGVAWFDMDDDGRLDLLVANDSGPNYVYRNAGDGRFEDVSYPSGAALDGSGREQAHMGVAIGDYDNDGRDDIHITNFADDFNVLYHNHDGTSVTDVSFRSGVAQVSIPFLGWGTDFLDYDNDGWLDLLVVNGHVYPAADTMPWNTSYAQRALLFRNLRGPALRGDRRGGRRRPVGRAGLARVGGRRSRQRRRRRRGHQQHRRRTHRGAQRRRRRGRPLADDSTRRATPAASVRATPSARSCSSRPAACGGAGKSPAAAARCRSRICACTSGSAARRTVSKLEVRWAGGDTVSYAVDRVDTLVTIDPGESGGLSLRATP